MIKVDEKDPEVRTLRAEESKLQTLLSVERQKKRNLHAQPRFTSAAGNPMRERGLRRKPTSFSAALR